jgi:cytochrome b involved in lipid metabolism
MLRLACVTAEGESRSSNSLWWVASAVGLSSVIIGHNLASSDAETPAPPGHPAASLPLMSYEKFKKGKANRVWVTLDGGVYDVT